MKLYLAACLLLVGLVSCNETGNSSREGKEYAYPGGDYDFNTAYPPADKWSYPSVHPNQYPDGVAGSCVGPVMNGLSALGLKAILGAIIGVAIVKLPLILLIKGLLLKIAIPLGLLWAVGIVLLPLIYVILPRLLPPPPVIAPTIPPDVEARSIPTIDTLSSLHTMLEAPGCLESIACNIGRTQSDSPYNRQIQWTLKAASKLLGRDARIDSYKNAYVNGTSGATCPICPNKLVLQQGSRSFTIV